jgi:hypothetical protein
VTSDNGESPQKSSLSRLFLASADDHYLEGVGATTEFTFQRLYVLYEMNVALHLEVVFLGSCCLRP